MNPSRRKFLIRSGWLAGGVTVMAMAGCSFIPPLPSFSVTEEQDVFTWVQLLPNGGIRFYLPRAELGQGISTGLSQIVAEELNVPLALVDCQYQTTTEMAPCQMTVGSQSIENYYELTAKAAAFLRHTMLLRAAAELAVSEESISSIWGGFSSEDGRTISYKALTEHDDRILALPSTIDVPIFNNRNSSELRIVGRRVEPVNIRSLVTGQEKFSRDVVLTDMHHGIVAQPPQLGAVIKEFDRTAALAVAGVIDVVEHDGQVGVVADTPMAAAESMQALTIQWTQLGKKQLSHVQQLLDIDEFLEGRKLNHTSIDVGDIDTSANNAHQTYSLRYDSPMVAHAAMEPRSGVASCYVNSSGQTVCEIWTGCQDPWLVRSAASKTLKLKKSRVAVYNNRVGGAFGGRVMCQASIEAAWLSKAVSRPVKVQWSREMEFQHNYVGPQFSTRINAGLDESGHITHWHYQAVGAPILTSSMLVPSYLHWAADLIADPGTKRGMTMPYNVENQRVDFADERVAMPTGPWRGLGAAPNTFAMECAIDELAHAAGEDPITFRLAHTDNTRFAACLSRLQDHLGQDANSMGIAAAIYKQVTYVAVAVKIELIDDIPKVTRIICVHDCGRVISPDQVRAQIEGNLVWGIGMALHEHFFLENGIPATTNFDSYHLPTQTDVPDMTIDLMDSTLAPSGAAEAAIAPVAAAIANGVFAATAIRHRQLPIDSI